LFKFKLASDFLGKDFYIYPLTLYCYNNGLGVESLIEQDEERELKSSTANCVTLAILSFSLVLFIETFLNSFNYLEFIY
jgi:hypothetical protein